MIGMQSTVLSGAKIGKQCVVGAHSLIPYGRGFEDGSLILGVPAQTVREATAEERKYSQIACKVYADLAADYRAGRIEPHDPGGREGR